MLPGAETLPMAVMLMAGALILIAAATIVGIYVYKIRERPPRRPNTAGPAKPPPVVDRPVATPRPRRVKP